MLTQKENDYLIDLEEKLKNQKTYLKTKKKIKHIIDNQSIYMISNGFLEKHKELYDKCNKKITDKNYNDFINNFEILNKIISQNNTISYGNYEEYHINFKINKHSNMYWEFFYKNNQKAVILINPEKPEILEYRDFNIKLEISILSAAIFLNTPNEFETYNESLIINNQKDEKKIRNILKNMQKCNNKIFNLIKLYNIENEDANILFKILDKENYNDFKRLIELNKNNIKELFENIKKIQEVSKNIFKLSKEESEQIELLTDINPKKYLENGVFKYFINKTKNKFKK